jgi:Rrf2 family protein
LGKSATFRLREFSTVPSDAQTSLANVYQATRILTGMRLTKRGEYALRALIDLGLAQQLGRPILQIAELARKENIPIKFLEQILVQLKEAGYLGSKRGKQGGYFLAKPMDTIKIGDVVRTLDGPLAPIPCVSQTAYERCSCPDEAHCGLRMLMLDVRNAIANILDRYTLEQAVEITLRKIRRDRAPLRFSGTKGR